MPTDGFHTIDFGDAEALRRELNARPGYYAAFLVEPIQGEGGVVEPPPGYLKEVRDACTERMSCWSWTRSRRAWDEQVPYSPAMSTALSQT